MTRILVVDDDEQIRNSLPRLLELSGYSSTTASDAAEARLRLEEQEFALALIDVGMPGESGMQLLEYVSSECRGTAAVMVTGRDDPALATTALEIGAYGYIIKPFRANEMLINVANALLRRRLEIENREYRERLERLAGLRSEELWATIGRLEQAEQELNESRTAKIETD